MSGDRYEKHREEIRDFLRETIDFDEARFGLGLSDTKVLAAARYMLLNPRAHLWRPLATVLTAEGYGVERKRALPAAGAIECAQVASLIFDDLPQEDNSDERRGLPSCHVQFGENIAQLAGIYLIARSTGLTADSSYTPHQRSRLTTSLSDATMPLTLGQEVDLRHTDRLESEEDFLEFFGYKTGELVSSALYCGGVVGKASFEDLEILEEVGNNLGKAYQLGDDNSDAGEGKSLGKPRGQDANKPNLVGLVGKGRVKELHAEHVGLALNGLKKIGKPAEPLIYLIGEMGRAQQ